MVSFQAQVIVADQKWPKFGAKQLNALHKYFFRIAHSYLNFSHCIVNNFFLKKVYKVKIGSKLKAFLPQHNNSDAPSNGKIFYCAPGFLSTEAFLGRDLICSAWLRYSEIRKMIYSACKFHL